MKTIAIIPARGGSKRIPHKNIRDFHGRPVIAYVIETALKCGLFDTVMVSTDDNGIADIARKYGAEVPFMRSDDAASDHATTADVMKEVLETYASEGVHYDIACCMYPTAPLLTRDRLREAMDILTDDSEKTDVVLPIVRFSYPPQRAFYLQEDSCIRMAQPENRDVRSQDLEPLYHDAGQFYLFRTETFFEDGQFLTGIVRAMELPEMEVQDIDSETDWAMAELKYSWIHAGEGV